MCQKYYLLLKSEESMRHIEKSLAFIDEKLENDLTLEELSRVAHMGKNYFYRQFRRLNGISPWEYITIKRIERAITYLETTNPAWLEIAAKCGYNNAANLYYSFMKISEKTPSDYKNNLL